MSSPNSCVRHRRPKSRPESRHATELFLTSVNETELLYGILIMPAGKKRIAFETALLRWLKLVFTSRILPFDSAAAHACAEIASKRRLAGNPISYADCRIAAIARSRSATLVPWDVPEFDNTGIDVINPRAPEPLN